MSKKTVSAKTLRGRFDSQNPEETTVSSLPDGVVEKTGSFKITVNVEEEDDKGNTVKVEKYKNDKEPFSYHFCENFPAALRYYGAILSDDQVTFLGEALSGADEASKEKTGKAIADVLKVLNDDLENSASRNQYQKILNQHKPLTDENRINARASIVRNFVKDQGVTDEVAISMLRKFNIIPEDFTLEVYRANKGKR
jgi:hypothetical protein